ncbi:putative transposase [Neisseria musculi]|uniref:Transposase n=1 Tax=Neisseria musculi TaxID=1815583 RepID=A0A7H1MAU0_9NEIS|nr:hypothetical protein [Neisseria musculi]QNT58755.1 putative integrase core domain protein [Neisseria musculi]
MKRLVKVEREIEEKLKKQAKRYNKSYPSETVRFDTKRLPLLQNQKATDHLDYLFVAIDDFSRERYAAILPDRTAAGAAKFLLRDVIDCCPIPSNAPIATTVRNIVTMRGTRLALPVCQTT